MNLTETDPIIDMQPGTSQSTLEANQWDVDLIARVNEIHEKEGRHITPEELRRQRGILEPFFNHVRRHNLINGHQNIPNQNTRAPNQTLPTQN